MVDIERRAPNTTALKLCSAHTCTNPFYNERPFQLGDSGNDDDNRSAQRSFCIDSLALRDELNAKLIEFVEYLQKVFRASGESITGPDYDHIESASVRVFEQLVQGRTTDFRATDAMINVFLDDLIAALFGKLPEFDALGLRALIEGRNSHIQGGALHTFTST